MQKFIKITKWGYEVWENKKQVAAGVGMPATNFRKLPVPQGKIQKKAAKHGIYQLG